ncbi:MAG: F0F1 ATP synthase subunit B [Phycisphaerales bacterium]|nr:F0F1 ATP synthase subunit B [Phycisphaerales bacterium]
MLHEALQMMLAAEGGSSGPMDVKLIPMVTTIVVFMTFFGIAAKLVWPKILAGLDEREKKILQEIESAEAARRDAADSLARQETELAAARKEAKATRDRARVDAEAHAAELRAKAEAELESMRSQATAEIESARQAAIKDLSGHAAELATAVASKIIERELKPADQQDLVEDALKEMHSLKETATAQAG